MSKEKIIELVYLNNVYEVYSNGTYYNGKLGICIYKKIGDKRKLLSLVEQERILFILKNLKSEVINDFSNISLDYINSEKKIKRKRLTPGDSAFITILSCCIVFLSSAGICTLIRGYYLENLNELEVLNINYEEDDSKTIPNDIIFPEDISRLSYDILCELAKNPNLSIEEKNQFINSLSCFIDYYQDIINSDTLKATLGTLDVHYFTNSRDEFNLPSNALACYIRNYNFGRKNKYDNNIIVFTGNCYDAIEKELLDHEIYHAVSRYGMSYLSEGITEILKAETTNSKISYYQIESCHIKLLSDLIGTDCILSDYLGNTDNAVADKLIGIGAFSNRKEANKFLKLICNEQDYINGNNEYNLYELEEQIIFGYYNIFTSLNMNFNDLPLFGEYIKFCDFNRNPQAFDNVSSVNLVLNNTSIFMNNNEKTSVTLVLNLINPVLQEKVFEESDFICIDGEYYFGKTDENGEFILGGETSCRPGDVYQELITYIREDTILDNKSIVRERTND